MTARCSECRHSVTYTHDGWCPFYLSNNYHVCKDNEHFEGRTTTPISTDDCECRYPDVEDIPEGTCKRCGLNKPGGACGHHPKKKADIISPSSMHDSYPGDCRDGSRYESIYTIEPTIVLGSRYYTPLVESGMYETEPIIFQMGE